MSTFSVDEYLSGGIDETVIVHRPTWSWGWSPDLDRYVLTIRNPKGSSVIGTQVFEKGKHIFERYADPSVIVTEI